MSGPGQGDGGPVESRVILVRDERLTNRVREVRVSAHESDPEPTQDDAQTIARRRVAVERLLADQQDDTEGAHE